MPPGMAAELFTTSRMRRLTREVLSARLVGVNGRLYPRHTTTVPFSGSYIDFPTMEYSILDVKVGLLCRCAVFRATGSIMRDWAGSLYVELFWNQYRQRSGAII